MKNFIIALAIGLPCLSLAQSVLELPAADPKEPYDNIHVQKLFSDVNSSSFLIWIKQEVKPHKHETHSEQVYILEGMGIMAIGEEQVRVKPGDLVYIPMGVVHSLEVTSDEPVKVLSIQAPEFLGKDRVFVE